jgi:hypothetical protein
MTARIIPFPARGPFAVRVLRQGQVWLVTCRNHSWAHADRAEAIADAKGIACGFGVSITFQTRTKRPPPRFAGIALAANKERDL